MDQPGIEDWLRESIPAIEPESARRCQQQGFRNTNIREFDDSADLTRTWAKAFVQSPLASAPVLRRQLVNHSRRLAMSSARRL